MTVAVDPISTIKVPGGAKRAPQTSGEPVPMPASLAVVEQALFVSVVGSRNYPVEEGRERVSKLIGILNPDGCVVTGGAPGVDTWAEEFANVRGMRCAVVRPSKGGAHLAGDYLTRNTVIVRGSDVCVAFWDGHSNGTRDSIESAILFHGRCVVALPGKPPEVWCR